MCLGTVSISFCIVPKIIMVSLLGKDTPGLVMWLMDPFVYLGIALGWWTRRLADQDLARMARNEVDPHGRNLTTIAACLGIMGFCFNVFALAGIAGVILLDILSGQWP